MKKTVKIILLLWPVVILMGMCGYHSYNRQQVDRILRSADGLVWTSGDSQYKVNVNQREDGELLYILIKVVGPEDNTVYKTSEVIDRDMYGGGFVRAAQVDNDPQQEVIVWKNRDSFFLDFVDGTVTQVSFDKAPSELKEIARKWHQFNVISGIETTILLFIAFVYYILFGIITVIVRLVNRFRKRTKRAEKIKPEEN